MPVPLDCEEFRVAFGLRIRMMRGRFALRQNELASALGVKNLDTISRHETGSTRLFSAGFLDRLCKFADERGISIPWLFTGLGPMELPAPDCHRGLVPVSESRIPNPESRPSGGPNGST